MVQKKVARASDFCFQIENQPKAPLKACGKPILETKGTLTCFDLKQEKDLSSRNQINKSRRVRSRKKKKKKKMKLKNRLKRMNE